MSHFLYTTALFESLHPEYTFEIIKIIRQSKALNEFITYFKIMPAYANECFPIYYRLILWPFSSKSIF